MGFDTMPREKLLQISRTAAKLGGIATARRRTGHKFTHAQAVIAGSKGGKTTALSPRRSWPSAYCISGEARRRANRKAQKTMRQQKQNAALEAVVTGHIPPPRAKPQGVVIEKS